MREALSVFVLRLGMGGLFFWFGADKYFHPGFWYEWMPVAIQNKFPFTLDLLLLIQAMTETFLSFLIVAGLYTRTACLLSALDLILPFYFFGLNGVTARNLGLAAVLLSLILSGPKEISLDHLFRRRR